MKEKIRQDALEAILERLEDYEGYYGDFHNEVFNTDYYIIGTYEAKKALEEYGVFDAIGKVRKYEEDNFGEVYTDISNPEKLVNMLYYIIGEEVLFEIMDGIEEWDYLWNNPATKESNEAILRQSKIVNLSGSKKPS